MKILLAYFLLSLFQDHATVTLKNVQSNKYLEISGTLIRNEKYRDNAMLSLAGTAAEPWQQWHLICQTTVDGVKYYHIRNLHSGKLITGNYQLSAFPTLDDRQLWRLDEVMRGQYRIVNKLSGWALSAGADTTVSQLWMMDEIPADTYRDDEVNQFFHRNNTTQGSAAFDQGNSIPLSDGRVLWVTQDAWDGSQVQPNGMFKCGDFHRYSNSVLIQPDKNDWNAAHAPNMTINNSTSNKPRQIFNIQPGTSWTWSGPGVEIGDKVYVHCGEGNGLDATGQSLYRLTESAGTEWVAERFVPNGLEGQRKIIYSDGMVKPGDGYVYVFGREGVNFNYTTYVHVARFKESDPLQWEYYDGTAWIDHPVPGAASKVAEGKGTVSVAYLNGKYILMTMDQGFVCDTTRNIYISTAVSPIGPFSAQIQVYTIHEFYKEKYTRYYTPVIHPEFDNGRNELLLTYCLNFSACGLNSCEGNWMDPYYYRVKAIRVPYAKIGL